MAITCDPIQDTLFQEDYFGDKKIQIKSKI